MYKLYLMIFFIVGANCDDCVSPTIYAELSTHFAEEPITNYKTCVSMEELEEYLIQKIDQFIDQKFASFTENLQKLEHPLYFVHKYQQSAMKLEDCTDAFLWKEKGFTTYFLDKYEKEVICDMETKGGGWIVIQQRMIVTKQVNFNRNWASYKKGFGDLATEFWIGNEFLYQITNRKSYELRIDMEDYKNRIFNATYGEFKVRDEHSGYQLILGDFSGHVANSLSYSNNQKFSTFDRVNDNSSRHCAKELRGGFWYNKHCAYVHLNGMYPSDQARRHYISWDNDREQLYLFKVQMKIRPHQ